MECAICKKAVESYESRIFKLAPRTFVSINICRDCSDEIVKKKKKIKKKRITLILIPTLIGLGIIFGPELVKLFLILFVYGNGP